MPQAGFAAWITLRHIKLDDELVSPAIRICFLLARRTSFHFSRFVRYILANLKSHSIALTSGAKLAPGDIVFKDDGFNQDRFRLAKLAARHGSVFRAWIFAKMSTCVTDPDLARQILRDNRDHLKTASVDLTLLFPIGFLRSMEGEEHTHYRRIFANALRSLPQADIERTARSVFEEEFTQYLGGETVLTGPELAGHMKAVTTRLMLRIILGTPAGSASERDLRELFDIYAPNGLAQSARQRQRRQYAEIRARLEQMTRETGPARPSLYASIADNEALDETLIGNLIHMTEFARHDVHGFWRWLVLEISTRPDYIDKIAEELEPEQRRRLSRSATLEAIRMNQSEFLLRVAQKTIKVGNYIIPKKTRLMVCVWENHRNAAQFENPNTYTPARFVDAPPDWNKLIPFGLDHHKCLGVNWAVELGAELVEYLAQNFEIRCVDYGTTQRLAFHFETGADCQIALRPRNTALEGEA